MRACSALLLVAAVGTASSAASQQAPATAIKPNLAIIKAQPGWTTVKPAKALTDLLANCPTCQTIATPTGTFEMVPGSNGQMTIRQSTGNPFGVACPAGLDTEQTAAMKTRLASLVGAPTVKLLEQGAAKETCPGVALAMSFAQIVLADDVSISKKP